MKNASLILGLIVLSTIQPGYADDNIVVSAKQVQALGIATAALPNKQSGEVSGLPAQVVIPGNQLYIISTPLAAMIEQTLVGVGDSVRKGQPIARLQSPALAEAQRGLLQASVQSQLARENLARDESLYKDGIISESRYRTTRGSSLEAQAAFSERKQMLRLSGMSDSAIAQLQSGNNLSSLLTITSPIDGVVLEKTASAGQRLDAAVPIFKIAKIDPLALEIQAPLAVTRDLNLGAAITIPAFSASGKLTAIGRSLTGSNQTVLLRGVILLGAENLRPGQFVEASISTSANSGAQWNIPNSAISRIQGRAVVFVQTSQGFRAQTIRILNEGAQNSVISGAFKGVEKIAVQGVSALKSSMMGIGGGDK
ncbi:MAG: efflux RND transporter periplasmic adaptor subunit [Gallionella sp.]|nr:efflux RND transporter periplasmic adaptor subunit [Gallionella sp.]